MAVNVSAEMSLFIRADPNSSVESANSFSLSRTSSPCSFMIELSPNGSFFTFLKGGIVGSGAGTESYSDDFFWFYGTWLKSL